MAEAEDDKVRERYRALGREVPPPELDARVLDAARRAAAARPGRRRWVLPVSIAAVVVLSVSVALQVERQRSDVAEQLGAPAAAGKAAPTVAPRVAPAAPAPAAPAASDNLMRAPALERKLEEAPALQEAPARAAARAGRQSGQSVEASPEQWLARIAELRRAGRNEEADRQLAEFRRRFPDYRIPRALKKEIERR